MNRPTRTVTVLVERRYRAHEQPAGLIGALNDAGVEVRVVDDGAGSLRRLSGHLSQSDVVVVRGRSRRLLAAARLAVARGLPVLDPPEAVAAVRDKAVMTSRLVDAGIRVPQTFIGPLEGIRPYVPAHLFPVICKPVTGDNGDGIVIVPTPAHLARLGWPHELILVQPYLPGDGTDLKLYVIGDHIEAVRKPSPVTLCTATDLGPVPVTDEMRDLVQRCREVFELSIFGIDALETPSIPGVVPGYAGDLAVIEVNDFPNFTTVPGASDLLARHVLQEV